MIWLLISRIFQTVAVLFIVATAVFLLLHLAPGDPVNTALSHPNVTESMRQQWITNHGLDQPVLTQYALYLKNLLQGDLGWSFSRHRPVVDVFKDAFPYTVSLALPAVLIGFSLGIAFGVVQARRYGSILDKAGSAITMVFHSIPDFWLGIILMLCFAYWIPILPAAGATDPVMHEFLSPTGRFLDKLKHMVLPVLALSIPMAAMVTRFQRAELLRIMPSDFVQLSRAKGLSERRVIWHHALRNALIPVISLLGLSLPLIFTGAVFIEKVFAWPGMGWTIINGVAARDYPLVTAGAILIGATVAIGSLVADILYILADPRVLIRDRR